MAEKFESLDCPDCGGSLDVSPGVAIATCPYCGSAVNLAVGTKYFLAHSIVPCSLDKAGAERAARSWMSTGFLKPGDLAGRARMASAELLLIPFFVMRAKASTVYKGEYARGGAPAPRSGRLERDYVWKVVARRASSFPVREYEVPLSAKAPFALGLVPKGTQFLNAEMDGAEAAEVARRELADNQKFLLRDEVDTFESAETKVEVLDTEFLHAPVWNVRYEYRKRIYELWIDGQTGQAIKGEIPEAKGGLFGSLFG